MQNLKVALFLAFKSIVRGRKATIILIVFILSLSFINLIFISSILHGIIETIYQQVKDNLTSNIVIEPQEEPTRREFITHAEELQLQIKNVPGVIATSRHYKLGATLAYDKDKNGRFKYVSSEIIGIDPKEEKNVTRVFQNISAGQYLEGLGIEEILLGGELAGGGYSDSEFTSLGGVRVGEKVKVTFINGTIRTYKVKGIFRTRFDMIDRIAFITTREAEAITGVYNNASQILVKIDSRAKEDYYINRIQAIVPNLKVRLWTDFMGGLSGISKSFDMITAVISIIGLIVAAITIFILIYINAINKKRQIGILKAIGIRQDIIIYSYIFQALFYTLCGVIIGSMLVFCVIAPYFEKYPLYMAIGYVSMALDSNRIIYSIISLVVAGLVAGFIPAWRVARENILKAIWGV